MCPVLPAAQWCSSSSCRCSVSSFYILGNDQDFLDSTQLFLLACLRISLSLEIITSIWLAGFLVWRSVREHRAFIVRWVLLALSFSASAVLLAALRLVQQWLHS